MLFYKNIISLSILTWLAFSCSQFNPNKSGQSSTQQLAQTILFGESLTNGCSVLPIAPIASSLSYVIPKRVKYDISSCATADLSGIGLNANTGHLESGIIGDSIDSAFSTAASSVLPASDGGTNIEVSFSLQSGGSLEIFSYGSGSGYSITGPAFRVSDSKMEEFYSDMMSDFKTVGKGTSALSPGVNYAYCVDFQYAQSQQWINAWPKACSEVSPSERNSMMMFPIMQMMDVPTFSGTKIGFVLNGATVKSFVIGSILSQVD